jgi:hypothetical protein
VVMGGGVRVHHMVTHVLGGFSYWTPFWLSDVGGGGSELYGKR